MDRARPSVHPHACGENDRLRPIPGTDATVHPHACGENNKFPFCQAVEKRYTPTRVGKTFARRSRYSENPGTPPRVWGKPQSTGNYAPTDPVHPHACGENGDRAIRHGDAFRYTPTRVGKTTEPNSRPPWSCGTPPRVWGKRQPATPTTAQVGTPPRVWGKRREVCCVCCVFFGTPPRVWGKRAPRSLVHTAPSVHPHACGENVVVKVGGCKYYRYTPTRVGKTVIQAALVPADVGTPPRVWGKHTEFRYVATATPVHPHACGENGSTKVTPGVMYRYTPTRVGKTSSSASGVSSGAGTPPRVWGKLIPSARWRRA